MARGAVAFAVVFRYELSTISNAFNPMCAEIASMAHYDKSGPDDVQRKTEVAERQQVDDVARWKEELEGGV
ncbi:hypothetical protein ACG7TL_004750 [Trametes sanguinea]